MPSWRTALMRIPGHLLVICVVVESRLCLMGSTKAADPLSGSAAWRQLT
jgi:hypothetical protein